jgi:hypothetical protein
MEQDDEPERGFVWRSAPPPVASEQRRRTFLPHMREPAAAHTGLSRIVLPLRSVRGAVSWELRLAQ